MGAQELIGPAPESRIGAAQRPRPIHGNEVDFKVFPPPQRKSPKVRGNDGDAVAGLVQGGGLPKDPVVEVQVGKGDHTYVHSGV